MLRPVLTHPRLLPLICCATLGLSGCGSDGEGSKVSGGNGGSAANGGSAGSSSGGSGNFGGTFNTSGGTSNGGSSSGGSAGGGKCDPNLTGLVRDFKAAEEPGGHPDFQAFTGSQASVGIVRDQLGADLKPVYASSGPYSGSQGQQTTSQERFDQWYRDTDGVNQTVQFTLTLTEGPNGISSYENDEFFPIDGQGFGNYQAYENGLHNYHFTFELHTEFAYNGGEVFTFKGDDDLWVFINKKLAIDLGGLHSELTDSINLDALADEFGLEIGGTYALDLFHAERRIEASRFRIDTSLEFTNCDPIIIPK